MVFVPCSIGRQRNPLALAPKKSIALQSRWHPSAGVAPVSGKSGTSVTALLAGQTLPMVAPVPLAGRAAVGVQGAPSEVAEQPVTAAIPLSVARRTGLTIVLMAPTMVGMAQPVMTYQRRWRWRWP